jgi:hypothetical protein
MAQEVPLLPVERPWLGCVVCACVRACVRACVCVRVCVRVSARARVDPLLPALEWRPTGSTDSCFVGYCGIKTLQICERCDGNGYMAAGTHAHSRCRIAAGLGMLGRSGAAALGRRPLVNAPRNTMVGPARRPRPAATSAALATERAAPASRLTVTVDARAYDRLVAAHHRLSKLLGQQEDQVLALQAGARARAWGLAAVWARHLLAEGQAGGGTNFCSPMRRRRDLPLQRRTDGGPRAAQSGGSGPALRCRGFSGAGSSSGAGRGWGAPAALPDGGHPPGHDTAASPAVSLFGTRTTKLVDTAGPARPTLSPPKDAAAGHQGGGPHRS